MTSPPGYVLEETPQGRTLVVTGSWTDDAARALRNGEATGLVLNYARGFCEGNLQFIDPRWRVRRLDILDRTIIDLTPIGRLAGSLEELSVQADPRGEIDLAPLTQLQSVAGEWRLIRATLGQVDALTSVITWRFDEADFHAFRDHFRLQRLTVKEAPHLKSLSGLADLPALGVLGIFLARQLSDISDVAALTSLRELEFEDCPSLEALDDVAGLVNLRFLGVSECGDIRSLWPVRALEKLGVSYAWGTTRIIDGNLSPLAALPRLREIRMRDRRDYKPRVEKLVTALPT